MVRILMHIHPLWADYRLNVALELINQPSDEIRGREKEDLATNFFWYK